MPTSKDKVDVLIVGSGASGGPFAWHLSKVRGLKIACLEQGEWPQGSPFKPAAVAEDRKARPASEPAPRPGVRYFKDGYPYDYSQSYWQPVLGNAVGGASVHYEAVWCRLHPDDFKMRSLHGVGEDWPITYKDLQ